MHRSPQSTSKVTPEVNNGVSYDKDSTILSSSVETDDQTLDLATPISATKCQKKYFQFFPFTTSRGKSSRPGCKPATRAVEKLRLRCEASSSLAGNTGKRDDQYRGHSRGLEIENLALRRALKMAKNELSCFEEMEVDHNHLLEQKSKLEALLAEAIVAANLSHSICEETSRALVAQRVINTSLESQISTSRSEIDHIRSMVANTAHDLKSPLHILVAGIDSIRNKDKTCPIYQETIDCLDSACAFMNSAISTTMDYSLISGSKELVPSNVCFNLRQAMINPCTWIKALLPVDGKIQIVLDPLPEEIDEITSDRHWFEENLLCLLSNAVKYSIRGVIRITVSLRTTFIRITVEDMGIGISPESKPLLFKQFSKLQNMATGSTGLGLFSLLTRSKAIGGACGVEDRPDGSQGSVFWFEFPYLPGTELRGVDTTTTNPHNIVSVANSSRRNSSSSPNVRLLVLVVDDSPVVVKLLAKALTGLGHDVITACNGAEGLEKFQESYSKIDLVFMDIQMPVMDGIEATRRFRELEASRPPRPRIHIICSSANSHSDVACRASAAGVDAFLPKPFTSVQLAALITAQTLHLNS